MSRFYLLLLSCLFVSLAATDSVIEQALEIKLMATDSADTKETFAISNQAITKVKKDGDYEGALKISLEGVKTHPNSFIIQSRLASLIGDYAEVSLPLPEDRELKEKMYEKSKAIFEKLMSEVEGQPRRAMYFFKNEYFYRFAMYKKQYDLGLAQVANYWGTDEWRTRRWLGYYSQGVGAANYAKELLIQENRILARAYAQKALIAWAQYFSYSNDYYNAYVHYALALGILGCKKEMMRALKRSASLIGRDLNYYEFKMVIDFIDKVVPCVKGSHLKQSALYKIVPKSDFDKNDEKNCIKLSKLDEQSGFIHAAYGKQVKNIMEKFFKKENKVLVLELDIEQLKKNGTVVKPEANKPGGRTFPHLYGTQQIPCKAINNVVLFEKTSSGSFKKETMKDNAKFYENHKE